VSSRLFDPEGLADDVRMTVHENPDVARPARVGFLAGMLAVWTLGDRASKATEWQKERLKDVAREALERATEAVR